jgi:hypothetical protein
LMRGFDGLAISGAGIGVMMRPRSGRRPQGKAVRRTSR